MQVEDEFAAFDEYLRGLVHTSGRPVMESVNKTFVVGYLANMRATTSLARDLFSDDKHKSVEFLAGYRLCQDALEHFFGDVRSCGRWCNNPTPLYFQHGYRALVHNRLSLIGLSAEGRNCTMLDDEPEECSKAYKSDLLPSPDDGVDLDMHNQHWENVLRVIHSQTASDIRQNILYYMAGWAARQVNKLMAH